MGNPTITGFIIGISVIAFVMGIFSLGVVNLNEQYNADLNETNIDAYNKMAEMQSLTQDIKTSTDNIKEDPGWVDLIGAYFKNAWSVMKVSARSLDTGTQLASDGIDEVMPGAAGQQLKTLVTTVVIILIVLGVLVAALAKRIP